MISPTCVYHCMYVV